MNRHLFIRIVCMALAVSLSVAPGFAARVWDGGGDGVSWGDGDNWNPDGVPSAEDVSIGAVSVDLGGVTRSVGFVNVNLNGSTLSNGLLDFVNAFNPGSFIASNANLSAVDVSFMLTQSNVLVNTLWSQSAGALLVMKGSMTIIGGDYDRANVHGIIGDASWGPASMTFNGGLNTHQLGKIRINAPDAAFGTVNPTYTATFTVEGDASIRASANSGQDALAVGTVGTAAGILNLTQGQLRLDNGIVFGSNAVLNTGTTGRREIFFQGADSGVAISNFMTSAANFDGEGLTLIYRPESATDSPYEVGGTDQGAVLSGFHDNYSLDHLVLNFPGGGKTMQLIDANNNDGQAGNEAFYVDAISITNNHTIDLNGRNLYYKKLTVSGGSLTVNNGTLTQVTGANLESVAPYAHQDGGGVETALYGGPTLTLAVPSDYGTVIVSNAPNGGDLFLRLDVSGTVGDINTLAAEIGAQLWDGDLLLDYSGTGDGNNLFFDWSFAHRNVTVNSIFASAIPEPSVAVLTGLALLGLLRRRGSRDSVGQ